MSCFPGAPPPTSVPDMDGVRPDPPKNLDQTGHLVLGPGARRDSSGVLGTPLGKLTTEQQMAISKAKKYAMEQSIKMVLMKQTLAQQNHQAKSLQRHQAVILMCRVYVGSINFEVKEDMLKQAFLPFGPIRSISMSWDPVTQKHKGFAFVEYEIPEAAQLSLEQMNGVIISGRNIKVGRPSNMPQAQAVIDDITLEAKNYNRIYVASIHQDLTQDDIKSVFEAFGNIKTCELAMSMIPGRHKGYGFIEYETTQGAQEAIASMNLFDLGGQYLRVGRSITPPDTYTAATPPNAIPQIMPTAAAVAAAAATAKIQAIDAVASNLGINPNMVGNSGAAQPASVAAGIAAVTQSLTAGSSTGFGPQAPVVNLPPPAVVQPVAAAPIVNPPAAAAAQPPLPTEAAAAQPAPPAPHDPAAVLAKAESEAQKKKQEELQKKLMEGQEPATLHQQENMSIKGQDARHLVMQKLMRTQSESVVVLLKNMVGPEDVDDDLQEEIEEECGKFGGVERVIIYNEQQSEAEDAEVVVKIFVEFKDSESAVKAKDSLNGRFFGGRRVNATIYDQDLFNHNDLSG